MTFGSLRGCPECFSDFGFGFNDAKFSDRTLLLSIKHESNGSEPDPISNGHETDDSNENSSGADYTKVVHINSIILAAKSLFFYKLFSNGMVESNQKHTKLVIQESAEAAFMDLLEFMYTNMLSSTTPSALVNVLIAADKYGVESCMKYCFQLLMKLPVTCELALLLLDLPSTVLMDDRTQMLTDRGYNEEMLNLPLAGIEVILSSDYIQANSEDEIFDFVLIWARRHYAKRKIRRKMLIERLLCLVRFPYMSHSKLEEFLTCSDISLEHRSKLVFDALSFETPYRQLSLVLPKKERVYKLRPVKVMRFDSPDEECVVYLDLKREECTRLLPDDQIYSLPFQFGGKAFYLLGQHVVKDKQKSSAHSFGLFLGMKESGSVVEFEFFTRTKPSGEFMAEGKLEYAFTKASAYGYSNIFGVPWDTFIAEDSPYFINGVVHIRTVIKFKKRNDTTS